MDNQVKNLITTAKSIAIVPSKELEAVSAALALFYSIQKLGKHATVTIDTVPEKLQFLIPSPDFIQAPRNFIISIPREHADISQIHYQKNDNYLKIHLSVSTGYLRKEDISFYAQHPSPDLIISLGISDFKNYLRKHLDTSGFLLGPTILNIDNNEENKRFGQVNIIENRSIAEILVNLIDELNNPSKESANCLLTSLTVYYDNFKSFNTRPETFQMAAELVKKGAEYHIIVENLSRSSEHELKFFAAILQNMRNNGAAFVSALHSDEFYHFTEPHACQAVEKLNAIGMPGNTLVLWQGHSSEPSVKGFFTSHSASTVNKLVNLDGAKIRKGWAFISVPGTDIEGISKTITQLL